MTTILDRPIQNNVSRRKRVGILRNEYEHFRACGMPHVYTVEHLMQVYGFSQDFIHRSVLSCPHNPRQLQP